MESPKGKELVKMIEDGKISKIVVEELSGPGRNTGDVIRMLEWLEDHKINVYVRNIGLQSAQIRK